jgi:hypothetical protein
MDTPMEHNRRLCDKITIAHRQACEDNENDVAALLLQALEAYVTTSNYGGIDHRESMADLAAAFALQGKLVSHQLE